MTEWCPKCHAMLPSGLDSCPACGAKLAEINLKIGGKTLSDQSSGQDIFWLSVYIIGIGLIPLLAAIALGVICMLLNR